MNNILKERDRVLKQLSGKLDGFYLAGGTALSLYYFKHRESFDLDFFTKEFSRPKIEKLISVLSREIGFEIEMGGEENRQGFVKMLVYLVKIGDDHVLKIDFVEDIYPLIEPLMLIDGIPVLSKPDIYFRKILTASGSIGRIDPVGRPIFVGGRQEAKDFFDLYFLSKTFMPLSKFVEDYCQQPQKESIIIWFRTYTRVEIKLGLTEIITDKSVSFQDIDDHFKSEVDKIIAAEI
jgi:hypothetical protein